MFAGGSCRWNQAAATPLLCALASCMHERSGHTSNARARAWLRSARSAAHTHTHHLWCFWHGSRLRPWRQKAPAGLHMPGPFFEAAAVGSFGQCARAPQQPSAPELLLVDHAAASGHALPVRADVRGLFRSAQPMARAHLTEAGSSASRMVPPAESAAQLLHDQGQHVGARGAGWHVPEQAA